MQTDIRDTDNYRAAQELYERLRKPGTQSITDAVDINVDSDGSNAVFSGFLADTLHGSIPTRICQINLASGEQRVLTFGPNSDRLAKYAPNGRLIGFLSDRLDPGNFQLYLLDRSTGVARATPQVPGWVEYFHWSPDGTQILLGVAGHGADLSSGQGAIASKKRGTDAPPWTPMVFTGNENFRWRRAWIYDLASDSNRAVGASGLNMWEANWCGSDQIAAVASTGPEEGEWYGASLHIVNTLTARHRCIYTPQYQLGWPAASASGRHLAIVEAVSSDRGLVAGSLHIVEIGTNRIYKVDTKGVDITHTEWRSDRHLLLSGHRGFETVVCMYDLEASECVEIWASAVLSTSGNFATVSGIGRTGDCVIIGESFGSAPEIAVIRSGEYRSINSFETARADTADSIAGVDRLQWRAPDGLEIQGWLLTPHAKGPHPVIMNIHGGPVFHWRPSWFGRRTAHLWMLLQRGYALFLPNPRGSSGRGQTFASSVVGEMGGADTSDLLSGLDALVEQGFADPRRLGVTGGSYGGYMTSWLITQDSRFAAAVTLAPITNHVSQHLTSTVPQFVKLFLADSYTNPAGKYFERSPIMHARKARTPTLNICGALDRCTPPEEAVQFHNALLENNVQSELVIYPQEGHGIRTFPAILDYAARLTSWFEEHMPATPPR
ncbi:S9 family peptidase [Peristeroidobacter agariperforans]|uniref:S9 family peptidase n=1 Tax=Peristeroidobacter agariperforans TaxID=268404 RepID=UPI0013005894|nr:prolyl oligopeptidase family serine peptidase [Peristeroidobacter agariperforans]